MRQPIQPSSQLRAAVYCCRHLRCRRVAAAAAAAGFRACLLMMPPAPPPCRMLSAPCELRCAAIDTLPRRCRCYCHAYDAMPRAIARRHAAAYADILRHDMPPALAADAALLIASHVYLQHAVDAAGARDA